MSSTLEGASGKAIPSTMTLQEDKTYYGGCKEVIQETPVTLKKLETVRHSARTMCCPRPIWLTSSMARSSAAS